MQLNTCGRHKQNFGFLLNLNIYFKFYNHNNIYITNFNVNVLPILAPL
jgi:hypothetical protein